MAVTDPLLVGRYALLVSLTLYIPVPLLDAWTQRALCRRLVRNQASAAGLTLEPEEVAVLADPPAGSCVGCLFSVVMWPIKKLLRTFFFFLSIKGAVDLFSEVVHRSWLLDLALAQGHLPGHGPAVRQAMDVALGKIDTRVIERALNGVFRDPSDPLNLVVWEAAKAARESRAGGQSLGEAAEQGGIGAAFERRVKSLMDVVQGAALVPSLQAWFEVALKEALAAEAATPEEAHGDDAH